MRGMAAALSFGMLRMQWFFAAEHGSELLSYSLRSASLLPAAVLAVNSRLPKALHSLFGSFTDNTVVFFGL